MGRLFRWLFALGVVAVMAGACAFALLIAISGQTPGEAVRGFFSRLSIAGRYDEINTPIGGDNTPRRFSVNTGDLPSTIGANLVAAGVIGDADLFVSYARAENLDTEFQVGTYFVRQNQSLAQIALQLTDARASFIPFRILEGWRMEQVVEAIDSNPMFGFSGADFLMATYSPPQDFAALVGLASGTSMEGFMTPGTYQLPPDITAPALVEMLTVAFLDTVDANLRAQIVASGLSIRDAINLAAIVQREALHPEEMPMIAGVYRNRLDINMKLDADPTVQYALADTRGGWWPQITIADYTGAVSPYNTYINLGLPPGPIASPGLSAIAAVANPAASEFYYFRADCRTDGYHDFARTYEEHIANGC